MNKKLVIGVALIFVSGILYFNMVGVILLQFTGGTLMDQEGIMFEPNQSFYNNALYYVIYSIPTMLSGLYLIIRSQ